MENLIRGRIGGVFPGEGSGPPLSDLADGLLARQRGTWPALEAGCDALESVQVREVGLGGMNVRLQFNPQRIVSMVAAVDAESIRRRPCFLCPANLPPEQEAVLYRGEHLILCNPAPIFPGHWTVAHVRHLPQALPENIEILLRLAEDFGAGRTVFYNGPRCGASAPDHLHFQAAPAGRMPVEKEILSPRNRARERRRNGVNLCRTEGLGRGVLVIEGKEAAGIAAVVGEILAALGRPAGDEGEPMVNLLCTHAGNGWRLILFPRRRHRPAAYFREGEERLLVSPGAVDLGGLVITSREEDFRAMTPQIVAGIFRETAFGDAEIDALLDSL
jgi:hypothetical protein